jgi:hypothetical protein
MCSELSAEWLRSTSGVQKAALGSGIRVVGCPGTPPDAADLSAVARYTTLLEDGQCPAHDPPARAAQLCGEPSRALERSCLCPGHRRPGAIPTAVVGRRGGFDGLCLPFPPRHE